VATFFKMMVWLHKKKPILGTRHDFCAFFGTKSAKTHEIMGALAFFRAKNVSPAFMKARHFYFGYIIKKPVRTLKNVPK
jgi:hypothetical protein